MIPEAWEKDPLIDKKKKNFYQTFAPSMEPWDGPAAIAFTDGDEIGATLDRNGLRPARYFVSEDDTVVLASEAGTLPVDESKVITKWRLQPGKMLLIDMEAGKIISDEEVKAELCV
jgi:glutamate synthase (NADPH/NADH) large chain